MSVSSVSLRTRTVSLRLSVLGGRKVVVGLEPYPSDEEDDGDRGRSGKTSRDT